MYEFVRNECAFQAYFGSQKGSVETLRQRAGNDFDLASLLIALLRAAGIPARYAVGMVELPAERARSWLGVDDAEVAGSILFTHGLEGINVVDVGGNVVAVRARRVWVEALVAVGHGAPLWFPLDPAFKQHDLTSGQDIPAAMGLDALAFVDDYWDPSDPMVTLPRPETVLELLEQELQDYLDTSQPGTSVDDVRRATEIVPEELGLLPFSLPYTVRTRDTQYSEIPADRRYRLRFELYDGATTLLDHTVDLPSVAGRRVTIDYVGATPADQALLDANGGIYQTAPSTVDLKPVLRLEGATLATGVAGIGMGLVHGSDLHFLQPVNGSGLPVNVVPVIFNTMVAGAAEAHAFSIEGAAEGLLVPPPADDTEGMTPLYWNIGMDYLARVRASELVLGGLLHGYVTTGVTNAIVSNVVEVTYDGFGNPLTFDWSGFVVDADRAVLGYWPVDGLQPSGAEPKDFLVIAGAEGSLFESRIYEDDFEQDAVCTIKLLELAVDQGITVYKRWNTLPLPANSQPTAVRNALSAAIAAGHEVTFPADPMTLGMPATGEWSGTAWIDMDPANGAAGYIISGGANGGATVESWPPEFIDLTEDDRTIVQVEVLMRGLGTGDGIQTSPTGDSPDPDAIFTRDMERTLTFEYQVKVTYDDSSTKTLPSDATYYSRTTRNTTKTFVPGNYKFMVWIARRVWWFFTSSIAQAERNISIVGVLVRGMDDGSALGKDPPKFIPVEPPAPEMKPQEDVMAVVIPEKAPDGTTTLATGYTWMPSPKIAFTSTTARQTKIEPAGMTPSAAEDDQEVNVTVALPGGKTQKGHAKFKFTKGGQDELHKMTVVKIDLDAMKIDNNAASGELEENQERDPGAFLPLNDDDDDYDASNTPDKDQAGALTGESDLLPIVLRKIEPNGLGGKYTLDIPAQVKVWKMSNRSDAVAMTTELDAGMDTTLYVEGVSTGAGDLKVDWKKDARKTEDADTLKATVFDWNGALNVPGYSIHRYTAAGALAGSKWASVTGGAIQTGANTSDVTILWDEGPVVGRPLYEVNAAYKWACEVNVVQVKVKAGATNKMTYRNPPRQDAAGSQLIRSSTAGAAMTCDVTIERIEGPTVAGGRRGGKFIEVGLIQNGEFLHKEGNFDGIAPPKKQVSSLVDGTMHLDRIAASTNPWYDSGNVTGTDGFHAVPSDAVVVDHALNVSDTPAVFGASTPTITVGAMTDAVDSFAIEFSFVMYLAVRTTETVNGSNAIYTQRGRAAWTFDGGGSIVGAAAPANFGTWTATTAMNSGAASLAAVTDGSVVPHTTGTIINVLFSSETWSIMNQ
jgi:hypothetical protein